MEKTKVTKKNIKRISKVVEMDLQKALSIFIGIDGNQFAYETKRKIGECYASIHIIPTQKKNVFITSATLLEVNEFCQSSKWSMFYGIEMLNYYDKDSMSYIPIPCISVHIMIEKDDEKK